MYERGAIKYKDRYKQLISYVGLQRMRNITPTDIDGVIDYNGKAFIYMDAKKTGKEMDTGQRMALENIAKSHTSGGAVCIVFIFVHDFPPEEEIIASQCRVSKIFWDGKWSDGKGNNLLWHVDSFEAYCKNKNIKI